MQGCGSCFPIRRGAIPDLWFVSSPEGVASSPIRLRPLKKQPVLPPQHTHTVGPLRSGAVSFLRLCPLSLGAMPSPRSGGSLRNCVFLVGLGSFSEHRECDSSIRLKVLGEKGLHHLPQTGSSPRTG